MAQRSFDKLLKHKKCIYCKGLTLLIEECRTNDPNAFWSYIKKLGPVKKREIPWEVVVDGHSVTNKHDVLSKWKSDFESLYSDSCGNFDDNLLNEVRSEKLQNLDNMSSDYMLNRPIAYAEVKEVVSALKTKKAAGIDLITNELLTNDAVVELMYSLFTLCFWNHIIPSIWRQSIINPIPKSGGYVPDPLQYHGLALQSCIYKVFSSILNKRICKHVEQNRLLEDEQNGFRQNRSCLHQIFALQTLTLNKCKLSHSSIFASFIDFQKAFDYVNREMLVKKLSRMGVQGTILEVLQQMYGETENVVWVNGHFMDRFPSNKGVWQGDPSAPGHFNGFIIDLLTELKATGLGVTLDNGNMVCVLAFADDLVLLAKNKADLQALLNILETWCRKWRVVINPKKSSVIHFRPRRAMETKYRFQVNEVEIVKVSTYKYLGVLFECFCNSSAVVEQLSGAGSRALGALIGKAKQNEDLSYGTFSQLFNSCVSPVLDYGSGAWSLGIDYPKLDAVTLRACRYYCGVPHTAANLRVQGMMGWCPGPVGRDIESLRLFNQICGMSLTRLMRKILHYDRRCNGQWSKNIEAICKSLDMIDTHGRT